MDDAGGLPHEASRKDSFVVPRRGPNRGVWAIASEALALEKKKGERAATEKRLQDCATQDTGVGDPECEETPGEQEYDGRQERIRDLRRENSRAQGTSEDSALPRGSRGDQGTPGI